MEIKENNQYEVFISQQLEAVIVPLDLLRSTANFTIKISTECIASGGTFFTISLAEDYVFSLFIEYQKLVFARNNTIIAIDISKNREDQTIVIMAQWTPEKLDLVINGEIHSKKTVSSQILYLV